MTLKLQIQEDMKTALKQHDKRRLDAIRLILAAVKQYEVDQRVEVDDTQVLAILDKMIKQRRDSISQYEKANRQDLIDQESFEVQVIQHYMPAQLSEAEIDKLIEAAVQQSGAASMKDMGKVMGLLKPQLQGRADMNAVSAKIKQRLAG